MIWCSSNRRAGVNALARQHTAAAIEALVKSLGDRRTRVQAAQVLLDRGWGKPVLAIDMAAGPPPTANRFLQCCSEGLDRLSVAELQQLIELMHKMTTLFVARGRTVYADGVARGPGEVVAPAPDEAERLRKLGFVQDTPPNLIPLAAQNPAQVGVQNRGDVQGPTFTR